MADHKHDIEKYRRGEMTPEEMHALEKKALSDPFLADALEGIESLDSVELTADLQEINKALQDRVDDRRRSYGAWAWTYRIAAGLLLLAVASYFIVTLTRDEHREDLALNKTTTAPAEQTPPKQEHQPSAEHVEEKPAPTGIQGSVAEEPVAQKKDLSTSRRHEGSQQADVAAAPQSEGPIAEVTVIDPAMPIVVEESVEEPKPVPGGYGDSQLDSTAVTESLAKTPPVATATPDRAKAKETAPEEQVMASKPAMRADVKKNGKVVKGRVLDAEDGMPMPGVNVTIKESRIGTITDENGYYEIYMENPNAELVFSFVGFTDVTVAVNNENRVSVDMSADYAALSEVVVVGYAASRPGVIDLENESKNIYSYAEPLGGRKAYKNYLLQSMQYPEEALANKVEGKVTVQFIVEPNGLLSDFNVLKSIGHGCDEEVIRLVKEGPKWSPAKRNDVPYRGKVKVRLRFTLPK